MQAQSLNMINIHISKEYPELPGCLHFISSEDKTLEETLSFIKNLQASCLKYPITINNSLSNISICIKQITQDNFNYKIIYYYSFLSKDKAILKILKKSIN